MSVSFLSTSWGARRRRMIVVCDGLFLEKRGSAITIMITRGGGGDLI